MVSFHSPPAPGVWRAFSAGILLYRDESTVVVFDPLWIEFSLATVEIQFRCLRQYHGTLFPKESSDDSVYGQHTPISPRPGTILLLFDSVTSIPNRTDHFCRPGPKVGRHFFVSRGPRAGVLVEAVEDHADHDPQQLPPAHRPKPNGQQISGGELILDPDPYDTAEYGGIGLEQNVCGGDTTDGGREGRIPVLLSSADLQVLGFDRDKLQGGLWVRPTSLYSINSIVEAFREFEVAARGGGGGFLRYVSLGCGQGWLPRIRKYLQLVGF